MFSSPRFVFPFTGPVRCDEEGNEKLKIPRVAFIRAIPNLIKGPSAVREILKMVGEQRESSSHLHNFCFVSIQGKLFSSAAVIKLMENVVDLKFGERVRGEWRVGREV